MDGRWHGSLFQILEATDENDLDFAIPGFRLGTHSDNEEEDRNDRAGTYRGIRVARWDGCIFCSNEISARSQRDPILTNFVIKDINIVLSSPGSRLRRRRSHYTHIYRRITKIPIRL